MADQTGRPIDPRGEPAAPAADKGPTVTVEACLGCGGLPHGGIGAEIACLKTTILRLRAERQGFLTEIATLKRGTP